MQKTSPAGLILNTSVLQEQALVPVTVSSLISVTNLFLILFLLTYSNYILVLRNILWFTLCHLK